VSTTRTTAQEATVPFATPAFVTTHQAATIPAGFLPLGTTVANVGVIVDKTLTAYVVAPLAGGSDTIVPFCQVHGQPAPVAPLVLFA
jgi:hypothetical protein